MGRGNSGGRARDAIGNGTQVQRTMGREGLVDCEVSVALGQLKGTLPLGSIITGGCGEQVIRELSRGVRFDKDLGFQYSVGR